MRKKGVAHQVVPGQDRWSSRIPLPGATRGVQVENGAVNLSFLRDDTDDASSVARTALSPPRSAPISALAPSLSLLGARLRRSASPVTWRRRARWTWRGLTERLIAYNATHVPILYPKGDPRAANRIATRARRRGRGGHGCSTAEKGPRRRVRAADFLFNTTTRVRTTTQPSQWKENGMKY